MRIMKAVLTVFAELLAWLFRTVFGLLAIGVIVIGVDDAGYLLDLRERRRLRELRWLRSQGLAAGQVVQSVGKGYEPPHHASVSSLSAEARHAAGVDGGMASIG